MGRRVGTRDGKRVNIYLPKESRKIAAQIDNLSEFVQVALDQASAIMAFDIIRRERDLPKHEAPTQEAADRWNADHPLDPLTAKRLGKTKTNGAPEAISRNPALSD